MSRLRANTVLNRDADGPFEASEGMNVAAGKDIHFTSEVTRLTGTSLLTTDINAVNLEVDDLTLGVNEKIKVGGNTLNQELQIWNDDTDTMLVSTDPFKIRSDDTQIKDAANNKVSASFDPDGSTQLYWNNTLRITTNSDGLMINGSITCDGEWIGTGSTAKDLGGIAMPFTCGLNGRIALPPTNATMLFGGSEYNGDNTEGAAMPHSGRLISATLHAENAIGDLKLRATLNGTQNSSYEMAFVSPTVSSPTIVETFYTSPMSFSAGDRINFAVNETTLTQLEVLTVTFFVKFD